MFNSQSVLRNDVTSYALACLFSQFQLSSFFFIGLDPRYTRVLYDSIELGNTGKYSSSSLGNHGVPWLGEGVSMPPPSIASILSFSELCVVLGEQSKYRSK